MGSLTPRSFDLKAERPTMTVEAACSKHRRRNVLPLHPELAELLPSWMHERAPDEPLFPKIARRKTWFMVKKDLERVSLPYETPEGVADFHASGWHSQYDRSALQWCKHYRGMRARAAQRRPDDDEVHPHRPGRSGAALASLPAPGASQERIRSAPGVSGRHASAAADSNDSGDAPPGNDETPSEEGVSSFGVTDFQELSVDVSSGGGGNQYCEIIALPLFVSQQRLRIFNMVSTDGIF